jgi:DNA-binding NarL/FixJ family response regulator
MKSKVVRLQKVFQIAGQEERAFKALIVGRDCFSGRLLADALKNELGWNAIAMQSADLLRTLGTGEPALIIISADLDTKSGSGFDLAMRVSCARSNAPIVILLELPTREAVIQAFHSGARGVFCRQDQVDDFIDCVKHVRRGLIWAGRELSDIFLETFRSLPAPNSSSADDSKSLTKRELEVVQGAARGISNKEIASELFLSEHTVKNYLFHAFEKIGVSSRVELLFYLTLHGQSQSPAKPVQEKTIEAGLACGQGI